MPQAPRVVDLRAPVGTLAPRRSLLDHHRLLVPADRHPRHAGCVRRLGESGCGRVVVTRAACRRGVAGPGRRKRAARFPRGARLAARVAAVATLATVPASSQQDRDHWFRKACLRSVHAEAEHTRASSGFCKCNRVLSRVASLIGARTPDLDEWLRDETRVPSAESDALYERFVAVVREGDFVEGQGNFGDGDAPPAHPKVLECRLTTAGQHVLRCVST